MSSLAIDGFDNDGFVQVGVLPEFPQLPKSVPPPKLAIEIISAEKRYGKMSVLKKFNMQVEEGTIYSLLGASGCGKTTALSCVIGINKLDSGKVLIFGERPGSPSSGIPGKRLGYMPQGIVLNREFTMTEVLHYFGKIYGMSYEDVEERRNFFVDFLNLKTIGNTQVGNLSEGQKRRVSFAVALIHEPEILILDEPTVGVDPLLRERMWSHLVELTKDKRTTVMITTHYIEEAKSANRIGLMRHGHLLVEESPAVLLQTFNTTSMEEIVFQLCLNDADENDHAEIQRRESIICQLQKRDSLVPTGSESAIRSNREQLSKLGSMEWRKSLKTRPIDRLNALFRKNLIVACRSIWFWTFLLLMPAINIYLICVCLVSEPRDLKFGIVNHEVPIGEECFDNGDVCIIANLSCRYLKTLGTSTFIPVDFESQEAALAAVQNGDTYGYMEIPANFSDNLFDRFVGGSSGDETPEQLNATILGSQIKLRLDMSNTVLGLRMDYSIYEAFRRFSRSLQASCGQNPDQKDIPLVFEPPVYGVEGALTNTFVVPGAAITFLSFLASLTSGLAFITEKNDGMLARARVAGVTHVEVMLSHLSIHIVVLLIQSVFAFLVMFLVFNIPQLGSNWLAYSIVILNGITGMSLGFSAASICDREINAMMIAIGAIIPTLLVSGTLSPFEALPRTVKYIGYAYPGTLPGFALKAILLKGWGLSHFTVWMGFVTSFAWISFYWSIIFIYHSFNS